MSGESEARRFVLGLKSELGANSADLNCSPTGNIYSGDSREIELNLPSP